MTTRMQTIYPTCSTCHKNLEFPPALAYLHIVSPSLLPILDHATDRTHPQCRFCAASTANKAALAVSLPPPKYTNPLSGLESHIATLKDLITQGVEPIILTEAVKSLERKKGRLEMEMEEKVKEVWGAYWGVWGYLKGQGPDA